jgi:hypothetical protein
MKSFLIPDLQEKQQQIQQYRAEEQQRKDENARRLDEDLECMYGKEQLERLGLQKKKDEDEQNG